jgi:hypothetical protein
LADFHCRFREAPPAKERLNLIASPPPDRRRRQ